ncbi:MAG TPA: ADP-forming succinate--CoA ligase subunit beta [Anaerolineae bacterium]|nr:ADP-forming succinate--CoA ligase subunit beta [Anaerolineae bacterium]MCB9107894.1 ADP-forming succinate--CoA ligase subunit beta [Anaerolineales bacterium]HRV93857.1 ADP-forming succinate--CoA ligase subunit beta [Anaerolineae bacterium]
MKLHEYQSKRIFAKYGVPIPEGEVATTPAEAREIAHQIGGSVVVKSQVLVGGRGKAGGVKVAKDADEAEQLAKQILGMDIKGLTVEKVLIDPTADIRDEIYIGVVIDRAQQKPVIIASAEGGVEIEIVAKENPDAIKRVAVDPVFGLMNFQATNLAYDLGLKGHYVGQFTKIIKGLYQAFMDTDASLAEINPLVVTGDEQLLAVDGKIVLDDNALYKHPDLAEMRDIQEESPSEREARLAGLNFIKLDGEIGCMVNGAGLAMATMDIVQHFGGSPANFLDIGGGANAEKVAKALRIILQDPNVKSILFNIFGGITRCDEVAKGILEALKQVPTDVPMVARLVGTNEEEGQKILAEANFPSATSLSDAAQQAVALAKGA